MTIAVGDKLPAATFKEKTADGPVELTTDQLFFLLESVSCSSPFPAPLLRRAR